MAKASRQQTRRVGNLSLLIAAPRPPASAVASCLDALQQEWQRDGHLAALWQAWPRIAGPQLAKHCRPLQLQAGLLTVGAAPGPWLQALQYHRHQLLGALRGAGFTVRDLRVQQYHASAVPAAGTSLEAEIWACHPSRVDVHGQADCPQCRRPAPAGEMARWGHCSFCRRDWLAAQFQVMPGGPGAAVPTGAPGAAAPVAPAETPDAGRGDETPARPQKRSTQPK
jgi:predicted nucleic acid-binding Zn ribbon protein